MTPWGQRARRGPRRGQRARARARPGRALAARAAPSRQGPVRAARRLAARRPPRPRARRSREYRIKNAKIGAFKPFADFDWKHPKKIEKRLLEDLFEPDFITEPESSNVVLVGPNGVGKTTLAKNLVHQALLEGASALWTTASDMLNDLVQHEGSALTRRLRRYLRPQVLAIDEVGYLSYGSRHSDLLFEVVSRRHQEKSIVITTNLAFRDWPSVFPNASCVTALIDRLTYQAHIIVIDIVSTSVYSGGVDASCGKTKKRKAVPRRKR